MAPVSELPTPPRIEGSVVAALYTLLTRGTRGIHDLSVANGPAFVLAPSAKPAVFIAGEPAVSLLSSKRGRELLRQHKVFDVMTRSLGAENLVPVLEGDQHKRMRAILNRGLNRHSLLSNIWRIIEATDDSLDDAFRSDSGADISDLAAVTMTHQVAAALETTIPPTLTRDLLVVDNVLIGHGGMVPNFIARLPRFRQSARRLYAYGIEQIRWFQERPDSTMPPLLEDLLEASRKDPSLVREQDVPWHFLIPYFGSLETLPPSIVNLTHHVVNSPGLAARLRSEAAAAYAQEWADGDELLASMPLIANTVLESLRLKPAAGAVRRMANEDFEYEGFLIKKDQEVVISTSSQHFMDEHFSDAERFDPDRTELRQKTGVWSPFGRGPHMCPAISMSETLMVVYLSRLVLRYDLTARVGRRSRALALVIDGWEESRFRLHGMKADAPPATSPAATGAEGCPVRSGTERRVS